MLQLHLFGLLKAALFSLEQRSVHSLRVKRKSSLFLMDGSEYELNVSLGKSGPFVDSTSMFDTAQKTQRR